MVSVRVRVRVRERVSAAESEPAADGPTAGVDGPSSSVAPQRASSEHPLVLNGVQR